jgi:hypothetical protein
VFDPERIVAVAARSSTARDRRVLAIIGCTAAPTRRQERTETDMTTPPTEPDSGTPADRAAGAMDEDEYLGRDGGADGGADSGADGGADGGADSGADGGADGGADTGANDPTTEGEEDTRFA